MNRFNWTYLADNGKKHHVGLMHGAQSGHLLVYCDAKILLIDFNVLGNKDYSFFIDEQLCEIGIELREGQFYYGFEINRKADTPRNRLRKKIEKRHLLQTLLFLVGIILFVSIFAYTMTSLNNRSLSTETVAVSGKVIEGKARILKVSSSEVSYLYMVDGEPFSAETNLSDGSVMVLENGMPLQEGDEFVVTYQQLLPESSEIDYARPTKKQIDLYRQRAIDQHLDINPQLSDRVVNCMVDIAFELKGIVGYADFYFQNRSEAENKRNNELTFQRLIRDIPFQNLMSERCWN